MARRALSAMMFGLLSTAGAECAKGQPAEAARAWSVVQCGHLIDVAGRPARDGVTIVVSDGVVRTTVEGFLSAAEAADVVNALAANAAALDGGGGGEKGRGGLAEPLDPARATMVDLREHWVLPGLIDCHVHITHEFNKDSRLNMVEMDDAETALAGVVFARRTIEAGFTTVRDLGARGTAVFALRDAINRGDVVGPRVVAAGHAISPTGGHADGTHGFREDLFAVPGAMQGIADGTDECMKAVRSQVKRTADCIKVTATGGVLSNTAAGMEQQFTQDELDTIVTTAHALNRKVAAHAHGLSGIKAALRSGVDSIEHGTFLDDEAIALFKEKGAYYVPTVMAGKEVSAKAEVAGYYPAPVAAKARLVGPVIQDALRRAHAGGVKIAFGTDCGVSPHGTNAAEFGYMVEAGMSGEEALVAATIHAADLVGLSSSIGTLEVGKQADLIAVRGDPRKDVATLRDVRAVMKGGVMVHRR